MEDGDATRAAVAMDGVITRAALQPLTALVAADSNSSAAAQLSANRVQVSVLQAAARELKQRTREEAVAASIEAKRY